MSRKKHNQFRWLTSPHQLVWEVDPDDEPMSPEDAADFAQMGMTPEQQQRLALQEARRRGNQRDDQTRAALVSGLDREQMAPELKSRLKNFLASEDPERRNLIARFIDKDMNVGELQRELVRIENEDISWSQIFSVQRHVRSRIQQLQERTQSYSERLPHKRKVFNTMLKDVRALNRSDDQLNSRLRRTLGSLDAANGGPLSREQVHEIYQLDPLRADYWSRLDHFRERIMAFTRPAAQDQPAINGEQIFQTLAALKKDEAAVQVRYEKLNKGADNLINDSISKLRRILEKEKVLEQASEATGITLKEGTQITWTDVSFDPHLQLLDPPAQPPLTITKIELNDHPVYDTKDNRIGYQPGVPTITLNGGTHVFTLGRFKKWVDAADAYEVVSSQERAEEILGLASYGIHLEPGMIIAYDQFRREPGGELVRNPVYVTIQDIRDGVIFFDTPIQYAPGLEGADAAAEMTKQLSFGQFAKWWRRYEAQQALNLSELPEMLKKHNEVYNQRWAIPAEDNPPIEVKLNEELRYPDEIETSVSIIGISQEGITLNDGTFFTFSQFFSWVKTNGIERVPPKAKEGKEAREEEEIKERLREEEQDKAFRWEVEKEEADKHVARVRDKVEERRTMTSWERVKEVWHTTQILSFKDFGTLFHELGEFIKRKHERRSKYRVSMAGRRLPWILATEFERLKEEAETGEVNKYKEAMEHWGIPEIKQTLYDTSNSDIAKGAILSLVHKGEMRWDDPRLWATMNRLTAKYTMQGAKLYIPDPDHMPPMESGEDMVRPAIDALWGKGTAAEWYVENTGKFNSVKNNFEWKFKQLENDPKGTGGPAGELERMLKDWRNGIYVNPMEYEAILDGALKYGKMNPEKKMFYIFSGVLAREHNHPSGEPLLHMDRLGELNSKYLNQFPLLDYFTQVEVADPLNPKGTRKLNFNDLIDIKDKYFPDEFEKCVPGPQFSRFLWEVMLMNDQVRIRISKGIRNAENMDHDDAQLFIPPASTSEVDNLTKLLSGNKKVFTTPGYMNGYLGYSQYVKTVYYALKETDSEADKEGYKEKVYALRDALNGFVRYDLILDNRMHKKDDNRARLDQHHYDSPPVMDKGFTIGQYQGQLRNLIVAMGKAYGYDWSFLYGPRTGSMLDDKQAQLQRQYEQKVQNLEETINRMIQNDGGAKALEVLREVIARDTDSTDGLRGITYSKRPDAQVLNALRERAQKKYVSRIRGEHEAH